MQYEDIHLSDYQNYLLFKQYFKAQQYAEAFNILQNSTFNNKKLTALILNGLFNFIVNVENLNDPNFNRKLIPVQSDQPSNQNIGEVWFQIK